MYVSNVKSFPTTIITFSTLAMSFVAWFDQYQDTLDTSNNNQDIKNISCCFGAQSSVRMSFKDFYNRYQDNARYGHMSLNVLMLTCH